MARFHIINTVKRELTKEEEKGRILTNLRRFHQISMFEYNEMVESIGTKINIKLCGIDKSGKEKLINDTSYGGKIRVPVSRFGIQECRRRNYALIQKAIKDLLPLGINTINQYMIYDDFKLWGLNGVIYWGEYDDSFTPEYDNIKNVDNWSNKNSVEICYEVLEMIRRKMMLDKLRGNDERIVN